MEHGCHERWDVEVSGRDGVSWVHAQPASRPPSWGGLCHPGAGRHVSGTLCPLRGGQGPLSAGWLVFLGAAGSPGGRGARVCPAGRLPLCPDLGPSASPLAWLRLCSQGEADGLQPAGVGWAVAANSWGSGTSRGSRCPACKESLFLISFPLSLLSHFPCLCCERSSFHLLPQDQPALASVCLLTVFLLS